MIQDLNKQEFLNVILKDDLCLIEIYGSTCGPCKMQAKILENILYNKPELDNKIKFYKFCIDDMDEIAQKFEIKILPTIMVFKNKQILKTFMGMSPMNILTAFLDEI